MVDLMAHEEPLATSPVAAPVLAKVCDANTERLKEQVGALVKKVSTETASVPLILPETRHGLRSLSAAQIRAVMHEKKLPCSSNKLDNIAALLEHMQKEKRTPSPAPAPAPADTPNPFLNGHKFPSRDESPLSMRVLSPETVAASIHEDLGDTRYVWFYQPWCLK